jgi:hypothetical protein
VLLYHYTLGASLVDLYLLGLGLSNNNTIEIDKDIEEHGIPSPNTSVTVVQIQPNRVVFVIRITALDVAGLVMEHRKESKGEAE